MKKIFNLILYYLINIILINSRPAYDVSKLKISKTTDQIMLVIPPSLQTSLAKFYFYIKIGNKWKEYIKSEAHIEKMD